MAVDIEKTLAAIARERAIYDEARKLAAAEASRANRSSCAASNATSQLAKELQAVLGPEHMRGLIADLIRNTNYRPPVAVTE
jgi:hypothetical protein